jgi:diacylglycerol kinase family enzyme
VVAGGDGTLSGAAAALAGRPTALAVVPAGTLNHFARGLGIPADPRAALEVALGCAPAPADVGAVNGRVFLNTSAVGAYVSYVRGRERLEPWLGYYGASAAAAVETFARLRGFAVDVAAGGAVRRYLSPLVFVGVGERELRPPRMGERTAAGRRGLHVLVVRRTTRLGLLAMAARGLTTGVRLWGAEGEVESLVVGRCRVTLRRRRGRVSVDGEIVPARGALRYEHRRDALTVVVPRPADAA